MRVSTQLEHINTLSEFELFRVIAVIDHEIARCKVAARYAASPFLYRRLNGKISKLQQAKATFLSEITTRRQQREC